MSHKSKPFLRHYEHDSIWVLRTLASSWYAVQGACRLHDTAAATLKCLHLSLTTSRAEVSFKYPHISAIRAMLVGQARLIAGPVQNRLHAQAQRSNTMLTCEDMTPPSPCANANAGRRPSCLEPARPCICMNASIKCESPPATPQCPYDSSPP
jgi:hypothetical protein